MALILRDYLDYFLWWRGTHKSFEKGAVSFFDPKDRRFFRIYPAAGDIAQSEWISLPVIKEVDVFKDYLRFRGNTTLLEDYGHLNDLEFTVEIAFIAEEYRLKMTYLLMLIAGMAR